MHTTKRSDGMELWWLQPDEIAIVKRRTDPLYIEHDHARLHGGIDTIAGPFETLDQAKVAYLMLRSTL